MTGRYRKDKRERHAQKGNLKGRQLTEREDR